jgi:hypothetical protein
MTLSQIIPRYVVAFIGGCLIGASIYNLHGPIAVAFILSFVWGLAVSKL